MKVRMTIVSIFSMGLLTFVFPQLSWSDDGDVQRADSESKDDFSLRRQWNAGKDSSGKVDLEDKLRTPLLYPPSDQVELKFRGEDWRKVDITFRDPGRRGAVDTTHTTGVYGPPRPEHDQFKSHHNPEQDVTGFGPPKKDGSRFGPEKSDGFWPAASNSQAALDTALDEVFEQAQRDLLDKRFDEAMERRRREQPSAEEENINPPPKAEPLQPSTPRSIDPFDWFARPLPPNGYEGTTPISISDIRSQPGGRSPAGPQFGPPKPGDPMPPNEPSGKDPFGGLRPPKKGGVYGPENPDGSWPGASNPQGAFDTFDHLNTGPKAFFGDSPTPTAAFDAAPQSRNMMTVDKPPEADGYKSGPQCD